MLVRSWRVDLRLGWSCGRVELAANDMATCWCGGGEVVVVPACDGVLSRSRAAVRCVPMLFEPAWLSCGACAEHGRSERTPGSRVVLLAVMRGRMHLFISLFIYCMVDVYSLFIYRK